MKKIEETIRKYKLSFWFSVICKVALLVISLISGFTRTPTYFSLAIPYGFFLAVCIPCFFINKHVEKKYENDVENEFKHKHYIPLCTSIIFVIFFVIIVPINQFIPNTTLKPQPLLLMYVIFLPWAVLRLGFEIYRIIRFRKISDPYFRSKSLINIVEAFTVLIKVLGNFYYNYPNNSPLIISTGIIALMLLIYEIVLVIWYLVIAIRGLRGKRDNVLEKYKKEKEDSSMAKPLP